MEVPPLEQSLQRYGNQALARQVRPGFHMIIVGRKGLDQESLRTFELKYWIFDHLDKNHLNLDFLELLF